MRKIAFILTLLLSATTLHAQDEEKPCPCCKEEYQQFHFWLGDWEATANGNPAGTNHIVLLQDGCIMQENWTSASAGYSGSSYNYYDPQDGQWHQTWVDNQGQSLRLSGKLEGLNMVLRSGEMKNREGKPVFHRITWTPNDDGTVRQHWESSSDGETEWQTLFDGLYQKKK